MTERRIAQRYDLSLPLMICLAQTQPTEFYSAQVKNISTSGVYFQLDQPLAPGTQLLITLSLPVEVTRGFKVLVRASGRVLRVDESNQNGAPVYGIASRIERYDIIRPRNSAAA